MMSNVFVYTHTRKMFSMRMQKEIPKNSSFNVKYKHTNNLCVCTWVSYAHLVDWIFYSSFLSHTISAD